MADTRDLIVKIKGDTGDFEKSMQNVSGQSNNAGISFGKMTAAVAAGQAIFAASKLALNGIEGAISSVTNFMKDSIATAEDFDGQVLKLQRTFGMTSEQASGLLTIFERFGLTADDASRAFGIFQKHLVNVKDSESIGIKEFEILGIKTKDTSGHLRNMSDVLSDVADKFKSGAIPSTERAGVAMQLFGRSGQSLIPILMQGSDGIAQLTEKAKEAGLILDQGMIDKYKELKKHQADLNEDIQGFKVQLGNALLPVVDKLVKKILDWIDANGGMQKIFQEKVLPVLKDVETWGKNFVEKTVPDAIKAIGDFVKGFEDNWGKIKPIFDAIGAIWYITFVIPPKIAIGVIEELKNVLTSLKEHTANAFAGIANAIVAPYRWAFDEIARLWNGTVGKISIHVPGWVPGIGGKGWDVPDIPMLADGGIVTKPTLAVIGETGPEAIVPLNKGNNAMGNISITVNMGMYAGLPIEKRQIALDLWKELTRAARANGTQLPIIQQAGVQ